MFGSGKCVPVASMWCVEESVALVLRTDAAPAQVNFHKYPDGILL